MIFFALLIKSALIGNWEGLAQQNKIKKEVKFAVYFILVT